MSGEEQPQPEPAQPPSCLGVTARLPLDSSSRAVEEGPTTRLRSRKGDKSESSKEEVKDDTGVTSSGPAGTLPEEHTGEGKGGSLDAEDVDPQQKEDIHKKGVASGGNATGSKDRSSKQSEAEQRGFGSIGHRQDEEEEEKEEEGGGDVGRVVKKLGRSVRRHQYTMSTFGVPALTCVLGAVVTYLWVGPQQVTYPVPDNIIETLTKDDRWFGEVFKKGLEQKDVEQHIRQIMSSALRENATKPDSQPKWTMSEEQWKAVEKQQKECEAKLTAQEAQMADIIKNATKNITALKDNMLDEIGALKYDLTLTLEQNLEDAEKITDSKIAQERDKIGKVEEHVGETPQRMENIGFLKIDSIGPILVILVIVEALLGLGMCILCGRHVTRTTSEPRQKVGKVAQPQPRAQPSLINTNNTNVLCLCFRDADEALSKTLGNQIVESCNNGRLLLRAFVVNSMEDVQEIPACRVALVFVDPDEREMIIEDERYHIGQGLRRHAVQRLLDSGVEVFIIIYNDRRSVNLPTTQLYNPKLGQVDEHAQLKRLKRKERVVSIRDKFHEHQSSLLIREINAALG